MISAVKAQNIIFDIFSMFFREFFEIFSMFFFDIFFRLNVHSIFCLIRCFDVSMVRRFDVLTFRRFVFRCLVMDPQIPPTLNVDWFSCIQRSTISAELSSD